VADNFQIDEVKAETGCKMPVYCEKTATREKQKLMIPQIHDEDKAVCKTVMHLREYDQNRVGVNDSPDI